MPIHLLQDALFHRLTKLFNVRFFYHGRPGRQCGIGVGRRGETECGQGRIEIIPQLLDMHGLDEDSAQGRIGPRSRSQSGRSPHGAHSLAQLSEMLRFHQGHPDREWMIGEGNRRRQIDITVPGDIPR